MDLIGQNDNLAGATDLNLRTCEVPNGFEERFQILRHTAKLGSPGAVSLFEKVESLLMEQDTLTVAEILRCQHERLVENPEENLVGLAKTRFAMLPSQVRNQVVNACKLRDFDFVRRKLRVSELFSTKDGLWVEI